MKELRERFDKLVSHLTVTGEISELIKESVQHKEFSKVVDWLTRFSWTTWDVIRLTWLMSLPTGQCLSADELQRWDEKKRAFLFSQGTLKPSTAVSAIWTLSLYTKRLHSGLSLLIPLSEPELATWQTTVPLITAAYDKAAATAKKTPKPANSWDGDWYIPPLSPPPGACLVSTLVDCSPPLESSPTVERRDGAAGAYAPGSNPVVRPRDLLRETEDPALCLVFGGPGGKP